MKIVYDGVYDSVDLMDGTTCPKGEPVEVSDELAHSLLAQDFKEEQA